MEYYKNLGLRIGLAILVSIFLRLFEKIFYAITVYPSYWLLNFFYNANLVENSIFIGNKVIRFIPECIAVLAYVALLFLILFTKGINWKKSAKLFILGSLLILGMNILRIVILSVILVEFGSDMFNKFHLLFWNFVSGIYVALVWIFLVLKFKIKDIPIVSDVKELYKRINT